MGGRHMIRRFLKWVLIVVGVGVLAAAVAIGVIVWRVYSGAGVYETTPPDLPDQLAAPAILVFSKTNGFRHGAAIESANGALETIAEARGWTMFFTENGAAFNSQYLDKFAATVWNNTSGDVLTPEQKDAFRTYVERGGGFVGIHGAGGDPRYEWRWYVDTLIGAQFTGHPLLPQFQSATVRIEDANHPATQHLPKEWIRVDEWYSFSRSPRLGDVQVLAALDEHTYRPRFLGMNIGMGEDHPIVWNRCVGRGRAFYSALGHQASAYQEPLYRRMLEGAVAWAAGLDGEACSP